MLLHHQLEASVARTPEKTALIADGRSHSYRALDRMVTQLALAMQRRGVTRGDRVALFMRNGLEFVMGVFASLRCGAAFMPINPQTKAAKLRYILEDATPRCVLTEADLRGVLGAALAEHAGPAPQVLVAGEPLAAAMAEAEGELMDPGLIDLDLAAIIYTSGSTGDPKGVMLSHRNMLAAADSISTYLGLCAGDVILCALPLSFDYGLYQVLMSAKVGATVVLEPSFAFPTEILELMQREHVTVFPGVPTMFAMLMALDLSRYQLPALRTITNTAAALSARQIADLRRLFPRARLFSMYGLTECKRVSYLPPAQLDVRPTSVGRGMPNQEVYLIDEQGHRLPLGRTGQLVVRGSNVMMGYWRKPEETERRLRPGTYPGERVLHTGDLFRTDSEGYLYFVGRTDDIIKSRGEKVSPREVENTIHELPAVSEVAVVGVPDPLLGEAIKAYVVLKPAAHCTAAEVVKHCHHHLENFMVPKHVEFVTALPQTQTGKVSKTELKQRERPQDEAR
jgi:long-chain acyl-CoA synthetase